jgi:DNA (cytosine-5)-methyltransferase 1
MNVLDLFSGIGGFSLAAHRAGFEVVAHCEIEPFPQAVLKYRFPEIPIFDDVRTLTKESFYERTGLKSVDIVCGGSPCQDLSVAGLQRGVVGGTRSGLFYEQIRIAKELNAKFIVWENVPGALSSNKGRDFERILCGFTGHDSIDFDKWGTVGVFRAKTESDYSVCYRILDTRFFRIPQKRRRIYLVASLGTQPRPEILFEREGVRGDTSESGTQGEDIARVIGEGVEEYNICTELTPLKAESPTLQACLCKQHNKQNPIVLTAPRCGEYKQSENLGTLTTHNSSIRGDTPIVLFENHRRDARYEQKKTSPTLSAMMGTGGNNLPLCVHASQDPIVSDRHTHALGANSTQAVCIAKNIIGRKVENGGNGVGAQEDISYTLNATGVHAVATQYGNEAGTLTARYDSSPCADRGQNVVANGLSVRRLTPLECERLQEFPDNWTRIPYRGKSADNCPDSPRYKACGNAITVAVGEWVLKRLAKEISK